MIVHILLNINSYIDAWINAKFVQDLFLVSIGSRLENNWLWKYYVQLLFFYFFTLIYSIKQPLWLSL